VFAVVHWGGSICKQPFHDYFLSPWLSKQIVENEKCSSSNARDYLCGSAV
jgi:hypothetical protein